MREVQDHYFRQAKAEGYVSRAAYKLIEIDDRKKLLHAGDRVLDCGCAPGSWLQVAAKRVGPKGMVVGIDLQSVPHSFGPTVRVLEGDFITALPQQLLEIAAGGGSIPRRLFDAILSDMAPSTTGDPTGDHHRSVRLCESLLDRAPGLLRPGGNLVMKVFEGETYPGLVHRTQGLFESAKGFKPKASRGESKEMYIVATGYRPVGGDQSAAGNSAHTHTAIPIRKPSSGWESR